MNAKSVCFQFLFIILYSYSYSQTDTTERCPLIKNEFYYDTGHVMFTSLKADSSPFGFFQNGAGIGFKYINYFDCPGAFDGQYQDFFEWSIQPGLDSFHYSFSHDQKPPSNFNYFRLMGQRGNPAYLLVSLQGIISGRKFGKQWRVNADMEVIAKHNLIPQRITKQYVFSTVFEKPKVRKRYKNLTF